MGTCRHLVFDLFGVLANQQKEDFNENLLQLINQHFGTLGVDSKSLSRRYWDARQAYDKGLISDDEYWSSVIGVKIPSNTIIEDFVRLDTDSWSEVNEVSMKSLNRLHSEGYHLHLLSNAPRDISMHYKRQGWLKKFESITFSCDHKVAKPEKGIYQAMINQSGCDIEELLFIDDRLDNVKGALSIGVKSVQFSCVNSKISLYESVKRNDNAN